MLPQQRELSCDECIDRKPLDGDLYLWQDVKHVELVGHGALLTHREHLEPSQSLRLIDHCDVVVPLNSAQGLTDVHLETHEVWLWLGGRLRFVITLLFRFLLL